MTNDNASCRRGNRRSSVLLAAAVMFSGELTEVTMRNLSPAGVLIEGDELPSLGSPVQIRRGDVKVRGQVAWLEDGRAGISFSRAVQSKDMLRQISVPQRVIASPHRRPGFRVRSA
jgi:PilZ domain-containing protein